MQILVKERLGITLRRVVAWWIDAFLAAAIIIGFCLQYVQNALLEWWETHRGYAETP